MMCSWIFFFFTIPLPLTKNKQRPWFLFTYLPFPYLRGYQNLISIHLFNRFFSFFYHSINLWVLKRKKFDKIKMSNSNRHFIEHLVFVIRIIKFPFFHGSVLCLIQKHYKKLHPVLNLASESWSFGYQQKIIHITVAISKNSKLQKKNRARKEKKRLIPQNQNNGCLKLVLWMGEDGSFDWIVWNHVLIGLYNNGEWIF